MESDFKSRLGAYLRSRSRNIQCVTRDVINNMIVKMNKTNDNTEITDLFIKEYPEMILWCFLKMEYTNMYLTKSDIALFANRAVELNDRSSRKSNVLLKKAKLYKKYQGV